MAATKTKTGTKKDVRSVIVEGYMNYVLEHERKPSSIYKFCKSISVEEVDFYAQFGSVNSLEKLIWSDFVHHTVGMLKKSKEYDAYASREKLLTFYYTLFELLGANRSYVLFSLNQHKNELKNISQLSELRKAFKSYLDEIKDEDPPSNQFREFTDKALMEGAWLQLLMILKFWIDDMSPSFEKTDVLIEKSINTTFDVLDRTPLDGVVDLAKFLFKEKMN